MSAIYENPTLLSLPEVLRAGGYFTAVTGKVFNSPLPGRWDSSGPAIVFSEFHNAFDPGPDNTYFNPQVLPDGEEHPDQTVANWAVDFIGAYGSSQAGIMGQPFFLAVGLYQPHLPWRVHQAWYDLYPIEEVVVSTPVPGDLDDVPATGVEYADKPLVFGGVTQHQAVEAAGKAAEYTRAYLAAVSHTDAMVGQLLAALSLSPYAANTDIVLWSDNGYHLGEKFHWRKLTFWEQAARVPLLLSSPGNPNYPVGDVTDAVSLVDLAATVLDLAGLPAFAQFEGAPLHDIDNRSPAEIFLNGGMAVVSEGIKIIDYHLDTPGPVDRESYDLVVDPLELDNIVLVPPGC
ncbi:MAG: sulfatase-like hydrolase/transferase [Halioglobus sp.]|nr:sulfatase-like hydrolase/transferase [Halioglobus sp.]